MKPTIFSGLIYFLPRNNSYNENIGISKDLPSEVVVFSFSFVLVSKRPYDQINWFWLEKNRASSAYFFNDHFNGFFKNSGVKMVTPISNRAPAVPSKARP